MMFGGSPGRNGPGEVRTAKFQPVHGPPGGVATTFTVIAPHFVTSIPVQGHAVAPVPRIALASVPGGTPGAQAVATPRSVTQSLEAGATPRSVTWSLDAPPESDHSHYTADTPRVPHWQDPLLRESAASLEHREDAAGESELQGVGVYLQWNYETGEAFVRDVTPGSSADKCGMLRAGDVLLGLSEHGAPLESVAGLKLRSLRERILGRKGSYVNMHFSRSRDHGASFEVELMRGSPDYLALSELSEALEEQQARALLPLPPPSPRLSLLYGGWPRSPPHAVPTKRALLSRAIRRPRCWTCGASRSWRRRSPPPPSY